MKKITFLLLAASVIICACKSNKENTEEDLNYETEEVISMVMDNPTYNQNQGTQESEQMEEDLSGNIIFLDDDSFVKQITDINNPKGFQYKGQTPCLVDFYADWCRPCSVLHPILVELAKEYKGKFIIYKVNTDKCGVTAQAFNITSIPTMLLFKRNAQPIIINGVMPKTELKSAIDNFIAE